MNIGNLILNKKISNTESSLVYNTNCLKKKPALNNTNIIYLNIYVYKWEPNSI